MNMPLRWVLILYQLLFPVALLFMLPSFLGRMIRRGRYRHKFGQRFALYSERVREKLRRRPVVWIHAVSVGEVLQALKVARAWAGQHPGDHLVLSTTTSTGFQLARQRCPDGCEVIYHPLDFYPVIQRALNIIAPRALFLIEAEVWPCLVHSAKRRNIPVFLCNARLSPRSERRYARFRFLCGPVFNLLDKIFVPDSGEVRRWEKLGVDVSRMEVVGNLKFDDYDEDPVDERSARELLKQAAGSVPGLIFCAGSTHPGEEAMVARVFRRLKAGCPNLFLVVVPRHAERGPEVARELGELGCQVVRRSSPDTGSGAADVLLVDSTGELRQWYALADLVFVGKSLHGRGGQNPVEPVAAGKPVLFGPHMENFATISRQLLESGAALQVGDEKDLEEKAAILLNEEGLRAEMAKAGAEVMACHRGSTERLSAEVSRVL